MTRVLFALILSLISPFVLPAQVKVVRGSSDAQSGMLYYDISKATDQQEKRFLYTICPDQARCMQLDFSLIQSAIEEDFIRVYAGEGTESEPIQAFGGKTHDRLFQYNGSCLTVEFLRDSRGLNTTWSMLWKSEEEGECIRAGEKDVDCPYVTEICGPIYRETFQYFNQAQLSSQAVNGSCLDQPKRSSWYKFQAQQAGLLKFSIVPANGLDDYDWVLWRADTSWTNPCPDSLDLSQKIACNYAAGLGSVGSTGMSISGTSRETTASGNPFARPIEAQKGDIFFLLINDFSKKSQGFSIRFNEVVLNCDNPVRAFVPINHKIVTGKPVVPTRNQFSRYTRILRINLNEKANQPIGNCNAGEVDWARLPSSSAKHLEPGVRMPGTGIHCSILNGLKLGRFQGYACEDMATPVHYGDILDFVESRGVSTNWDMSVDAMSNFGNYIELIVDEIFDRTSARKRQQIRMVRLIWSAPETNLPDYNVAVFQWEDLVDLFDQVWVSNPHNDVNNLSLKDFIKGQMYSSINIHQRHQNNRTSEEAAHGEQKTLEFEAYHWDR